MNVLMPQLGETVNEGTVAAWHKKVGDTVAKNEVLLDVETDKVATEIPAPASGILIAIHVAEGNTVDVGVVLAEIAAPGDSQTPEQDDAPQAATTNSPATMKSESADSQPAIMPADDEQKLSPVVRRLVAEHKLDLSAIQGSGQGGRITRRDVLAIIDRGPADAAPPGKRIPFDRVRKLTAEHMVRSKSTSPHVLQAIEVDFSAVEVARNVMGEEWRRTHNFSLTYLPFVARAVTLAIEEFPCINASVDGEALVLHDDINLAIAIDLNFEGLVAPVIQNSASLSVAELARRIHDLAARARSRRLTADDFAGGTYTLSNLGSSGTLFTAPIINQPQVAILSMDAISKRATVVDGPDGDEIAIRPIGVLAQSFDHRAFDGSYSAAYLKKVKDVLEQTDWANTESWSK